MIARLAYAVRYAFTGQLPPDPNEHAHNLYWIELGRTGCMIAATNARDLILTGGAS